MDPLPLALVQVTGFSVGGRVVDGNGVGVDGVKIIVDGHERFVTDKEGYYKLDQVIYVCAHDNAMANPSSLSRIPTRWCY